MKKLLKHKNKIIVGVLLIAVLAFVYWWGGDSPALRGWSPTTDTKVSEKGHLTADEKIQLAEELTAADEAPDTPTPAVTEVPEVPTPTETKTPANATNEVPEYEPEINSDDKNKTTQESSTAEIVSNENKALTCTLSVSCESILKNIEWLNAEKRDIVPKDGIIFAEKEISFSEGESVFDVLIREMKNNKIHFEYVSTPMYNSAYIEGIANLYEFDCGELSGWIYKVNGQVPNCGCSEYLLKSGDKIAWIYTCTLGNDT